MNGDESRRLREIVETVDRRGPATWRWPRYVRLVEGWEMHQETRYSPARITGPGVDQTVPLEGVTRLLRTGWKAGALQLLEQHAEEVRRRKAEQRRNHRAEWGRRGARCHNCGQACNPRATICATCNNWRPRVPAFLDRNRKAGPLSLWLRWQRENPFVQVERKDFFHELGQLGLINHTDYGLDSVGRWLPEAMTVFQGEAA